MEGGVWEITLNYSTQAVEAGRRLAPNPLTRPAIRSWGSMEYQRPMVIDYNGTPILNTMGEKFDPPYEETVCCLVLSVKRNEPVFNHNLALYYANTVNNDTFYGAAPGYVRCRAPQGHPEQ